MNNFNRIFQHPPEKQFLDKYTGLMFSVEDIENICTGTFAGGGSKMDFDGMLKWLDRFQEVTQLPVDQDEAQQHSP